MALPATDDFNRSDGALGSNWTFEMRYDGSGVMEVVSNRAAAVSCRGPCHYWNADSFNADQYAECVCGPGGTGYNAGPAVRVGSGAAYILSAENKLFYKLTGGTSFTSIGSWALSAAGDTYRLEVTGTTVEVFRNGSSVASVTDSAIASGAAGLWGWENFGLDDWEGGNLGGGGGGPTARYRLTLLGVA